MIVNSGTDRAEHVAHLCGSEGRQLTTRLVLAAVNVNHVTDFFELGVQQGRAATTLEKPFDLTPMVCMHGTAFSQLLHAQCGLCRTSQLCRQLCMFIED